MRPLVAATAWAVVSAIAFSTSSAAAKFLGQKLPTAELSFFRAAFGVLLLVGAWRFLVGARKARDPWGHVIRCGLGVVALYGFMHALATLPLALASLLFVTRVLLLPVAARLMLGERSGPAVWIAVTTGFVGAVVSLWPALTLPELRLGIAAALVASISSAGSQVAVRRLTATNPAGLIVLIYTAASVAATLPFAVTGWVAPLPSDWPILAALGGFAVLAQFAAAKAFSWAPVGFLAPLDVLAVPVGAMLGLVLFGEVPTAYDWIGGGLIVIAAFFVNRPGGRRFDLKGNIPHRM
ncbi:DMT family transporter [Azospirillum doebereinerae]|uniref:DMT family transporter n=1 Tax=Azospirillum doebereinerae TaxID=92933 RepID=A0A433JE19_9PROT|nr:DMT family transporter [Azospirillum doebereinerae]RUQ75054.1 DMT family transporter [Azospirillum doebereinerae]